MKIFQTDFIHGSYIDQVSKVSATNTNGSFKRTNRSNAYYVDTSTTLAFTGLSLDLIDLITECKGVGTLRITIGSTNNDIVLNSDSWVFEKDIFALSSQTTVTITCTSGFAYVSQITGFDHSLSTLQENDLKKAALSQKATGTGIRFKDCPIKPTSLNEDGLVFASAMQPSKGGILTDISGSGNNGTINGALSCKNGMAFDGVKDYIQDASFYSFDNKSEISILMRVKFLSNSGTDYFISLPENITGVQGVDLNINGTNIQWSLVTHSDSSLTDVVTSYINDIWYDLGYTYDGVTLKGYLDGVLIGSHIVTLGTGIKHTSGELFLGAFSLTAGAYSNVEIADARIYNTAKDLAFIQKYHNQFVKTVIDCDYQYSPVGGFPRDFIRGTGTYSTQELAAADTSLELPIGYKYLKNTVAGTCAIQNNNAYGVVFEGDVYKRADANIYRVYPIKDNSDDRNSGNGYEISIHSNESIYLNKITAGGISNLIVSSVSYLSINTWYKLKLERTKAGIFSFYIKGGSFGNAWTLIDSSVFGTNPVTDNTHTTSKYCVFDLDANDRIGNFTIDNGVKV